MIKVSELKGRAVIGLEHAQKIGTLQGLVMDPQGAQALGLKVTGVEGKSTLVVPATALHKIGPDAITVREAGVGPDGANIGPLGELPDSHALADTKVVTEGGTFLGTISDVYVDETSLQVLGYELAGQGWENLLGKGKFLRAQPGYRYGGDIMLVPDSVRPEEHASGRETERSAAADAEIGARTPYVPGGTRHATSGAAAHSAPTEMVPQMNPVPPAAPGMSSARYVIGPSGHRTVTDPQGTPFEGQGSPGER